LPVSGYVASRFVRGVNCQEQPNGVRVMTKRYALLLAAAVGLLCSAATYADKKLTVATFNCEFLTRPKVHMKFGEPFDLPPERQKVWDEPGYRDKRFNEAAKAVARFIEEIDADVLGLQEVGDERDVNELLEEVRKLGLDYPFHVVGGPVEEETFQNTAVFSKFELHDLISPIPGREAYDTELDDPEAEAWTDVRKGLRVTFTAYGQTFHTYVLHLTSERGGYDADARRIAEASIVRRHYLPLLTRGEHVIVMGDLNDRRNEPAIRRIRGRDDIQPDLIQTGRYYYFDRGELDNRWTYNFRGVRNQIDHVLLSESIEESCPRIRARTLDQGSSLVSDHRPFIVELHLKD
jgi:endonuclease/exonuclease/phosphatase family metal-dependent hydrolase